MELSKGGYLLVRVDLCQNYRTLCYRKKVLLDLKVALRSYPDFHRPSDGHGFFSGKTALRASTLTLAYFLVMDGRVCTPFFNVEISRGTSIDYPYGAGGSSS
jgi:hypothetical protein